MFRRVVYRLIYLVIHTFVSRLRTKTHIPSCHAAVEENNEELTIQSVPINMHGIRRAQQSIMSKQPKLQQQQQQRTHYYYYCKQLTSS